MRNQFLFLLIVLFIHSALFAKETKKIDILITSDLHGWYDSTALFPKRKKYGLKYIEPLIKEQKKHHPNSILVDVGDLFFGSPMSSYAIENNMSPNKIPFMRSLKRLRYDVIVLGNHDFEIYKEAMKYIEFLPKTTWLASNVTHKNKNLTSYKIINRNGIRIAFLGLVTPSTYKWVKYTFPYIRFDDMLETSKKLVKKIIKQEKPDLIVGLFHAGLNPFRSHYISQIYDQPLGNSVLQIIKAIPEIDVILSGHDHRINLKNGRKLPRLYTKPALSVSHHGKHLIKLTVEHKNKTNNFNFKVFQAKQKVQSKKEDQLFLDHFNAYLSQETKWKKINSANRDQVKKCLTHTFAHSLITDLTTDFVFLDELKKKGILKSHKITKRDIFTILPYNNKANILLLSGFDLNWLEKKLPQIIERKRRKTYHTLYKQAKYSSASIEKNHAVIMSDYHAIGGGGILANLLTFNPKIIYRDSISFRERLFQHLSLQKPDQTHCDMFTIE